jgi:mannose-6-phosphate isomerase-like protein (cupin superfamily)
VNDSVVRIGIVEGEYHWHKHDNDDEFFFVLSGQLLIDLEGQTIELNPNQGVTISKGVMHRPRAPQKTVMLMFETSAIQPTGD